jgi:hypothetical protein
VTEIREEHSKGTRDAEFISWHEGSHLIVKDPTNCPTFKVIQEKIAKYFSIELKSVGTRFNWYRDSSDWKPFHHDSAAFNRKRAGQYQSYFIIIIIVVIIVIIIIIMCSCTEHYCWCEFWGHKRASLFERVEWHQGVLPSDQWDAVQFWSRY